MHGQLSQSYVLYIIDMYTYMVYFLILHRLTSKLVVRERNLDHNHRIGPDAHYSANRKLSKVEKETLNEILSLKPKTKHVKEMIESKYGKFVTLKDIHNLKSRMKTEACGGLHDAQLLLVELEKSLKGDPLASGGVILNEEDSLEVLYYRSGLMKQMFHKFPEILLVDATYNANGVGMPLYCLMVEDGFGHGRVVAVMEEDPSPLNTDESNKELFTQADHLLAAASSVYGQMVVTEEEHLPSDRQQDEPMIVTEDDCLPPYPELSSGDSEQIISAVKSPLQPMVSTEMCPRVRDNDSMIDLAELQHQARLKLGLLIRLT